MILPLEQQVTNKELSEELKEAGIRQDTQYKYCGGHTYYFDSDEGKFEPCKNTDLLGEDEYCHTAALTCEFFTAAYTATELGEMLPKVCYSFKPHNSDAKYTCYWQVEGYKKYEPHQLKRLSFHSNTEADARGKMLLYLKQHNLL